MQKSFVLTKYARTHAKPSNKRAISLHEFIVLSLIAF
ncbi:hypothetical protein HNR27_003035 [Ornithinibacillus bavariensis]